jgi:hypothetical protein
LPTEEYCPRNSPPAFIRHLIALFSCFFWLLPLALGKQQTPLKAGAGADNLSLWIGHWISHGDPGDWHAESDCQWSRGHQFVICDQLLNGQTRQLLVISFDSSKNIYRMNSLGTSREPVVQTATVRDKVWTVTGSFVENGQTYAIRGTTDFREPGIYHDKQEHSEDGGVQLD